MKGTPARVQYYYCVLSDKC